MAQVPISGSQGFNSTVTPQGATQREDVTATPDMFGAGIGQAFQGLGQTMNQASTGIENIAVKMQDLHNQSVATNADTNASALVDDYLYNPQNGLFSKQGADALNAWGDGGANAKAKLQDIHDTISDSLQNDYQKRDFDQRWQRVSAMALGSAGAHASQQYKVYQNAVSDASVNQATNQAALNWNNDEAFGMSLGTIHKAVDDQAKINGINDANWIETKTQDYVDKAWHSRLSAMAVQDAPGAQQLLEKAVTGSATVPVRGPDGQPLKNDDGSPMSVPVQGPSGIMAAQMRAELYNKSNQQLAQTGASTSIAKFSQPSAAPDAGMDAVVSKITSQNVEGTDQNPNSSAVGTGQFVDKTWLGYMDKLHPEFRQEGMTNDQILALRTDPERGAALGLEATKAYAQDNSSKLVAAGYQASPTNIYLSHWFDAPGAVKLLQADPNTPIEKSGLSRSAIDANDLGGKTVGDVIAMAAKKMDGVQMSAPKAPPTQAQIVQANANAILDDVRAKTQGNPQLQQEMLAQAQNQISTILHGQNLTDNADNNTVTAALYPKNGTAPKSLDELRQDPNVSAAYDRVTQSYPGYVDHYANALKANANGSNPVRSDDTDAQYYQLWGQAGTDPEAFKSLNLAQYIGKLPRDQVDHLVGMQTSMNSKEYATSQNDQLINNAMSNDRVKTMSGAVSIFPPKAGEKPSESYNNFQGRMSAALQIWKQDNPSKSKPTDTDLAQMASGILQNVTKQTWLGSTQVPLVKVATDGKPVTPIGSTPERGQISYSIPPTDKAQIIDAYQRANGGRTPTEAELQARYHAAQQRKGYVQ